MARGDMDQYSDWDFAVRGLPAAEYYSAFAKLMKILSRSVDLVDLDEVNPFSAYVLSKKRDKKTAELIREAMELYVLEKLRTHPSLESWEPVSLGGVRLAPRPQSPDRHAYGVRLC